MSRLPQRGLITTLRTNRERSFGSNRWVKVRGGQLWFDQSPSWTQQRFLIAAECSRTRDRNLTQNFGCEQTNAPNLQCTFAIWSYTNAAVEINVHLYNHLGSRISWWSKNVTPICLCSCSQQARQTQATVDIVREQQRTIEELQVLPCLPNHSTSNSVLITGNVNYTGNPLRQPHIPWLISLVYFSLLRSGFSNSFYIYSTILFSARRCCVFSIVTKSLLELRY